MYADLKVFSYEDNPAMPGKRLFLVSPLAHFWKMYLEMQSKHFYEIIKEDQPCRLYFDLEFNVELNVHANGDEMVKVLKRYLVKELQEQFQIEVSENNILELDSSSR